MNTFLSVLVSILEVIVILGVLISIHEAGHLAAAKAFHVYCFEYSIGFGPKILKKKRKTGETYFCIGAIPFGGYVSMYGEAGSLPEGTEEPDPSRSLKSKRKWQQAIIMVAGVTMNFVLGLILIFISNIAFPQYYYGYGAAPIEGNLTTVSTSFTTVSRYGDDLKAQIQAAIDGNPDLKDEKPENFVFPFPAALYSGEVEQTIFITDGVTITGSNESWVAAYYPSSLIDTHSLASSVFFYNASLLQEGGTYTDVLKDKLGINAIVSQNDVAKGSYFQVKNAGEGTEARFKIHLMPLSLIGGENRVNADFADIYKNKSAVVDVTLVAKNGAWAPKEGSEIDISVVSGYLGWTRAWEAWASDVPYACGAIVKGFASLFTGGIQNVSGIVGITAAMPSITASGGASRIFFFAGLLSINLAFFNLLPFPGLDGWQLLTVAVEGIFRKEIPAKVKGIVSFTGIALLILFMVFITIKDIIGLF